MCKNSTKKCWKGLKMHHINEKICHVHEVESILLRCYIPKLNYWFTPTNTPTFFLEIDICKMYIGLKRIGHSKNNPEKEK
jgi:hypothetical protein